MSTLILLVLFGIISALFGTQNTAAVPLTIAGYTLSGIPIYLIVLGSLFIGLFLSSLITLVNSITSSLTLHGKDVKIKETKRTVTDLSKRNQQLEQEIAKLKERTTSRVSE